MTISRRLVLTLLVGASAAVLGCRDNSPFEAPAARNTQESLLGSLLQPTGLISCSPLPLDSVTQAIGPQGGTIVVGAHRLFIPAGALDSAVTITAVAPSDSVNRVIFEPSGLAFQQPASLTMSYATADSMTTPVFYGGSPPSRPAHSSVEWLEEARRWELRHHRAESDQARALLTRSR